MCMRIVWGKHLQYSSAKHRVISREELFRVKRVVVLITCLTTCHSLRLYRHLAMLYSKEGRPHSLSHGTVWQDIHESDVNLIQTFIQPLSQDILSSYSPVTAGRKSSSLEPINSPQYEVLQPLGSYNRVMSLKTQTSDLGSDPRALSRRLSRRNTGSLWNRKKFRVFCNTCLFLSVTTRFRLWNLYRSFLQNQL